MLIVALVISAFVIVLGLVGIVAPARILKIALWFQTPVGLYAASALRLVFGASLFLVAPGSREPHVLRVLGILIFVAGMVTPFIGVDRSRRLLDWWSARGPGFNRVMSAVGLAFGAFLIWAMTP